MIKTNKFIEGKADVILTRLRKIRPGFNDLLDADKEELIKTIRDSRLVPKATPRRYEKVKKERSSIKNALSGMSLEQLENLLKEVENGS